MGRENGRNVGIPAGNTQSDSQEAGARPLHVRNPATSGRHLHPQFFHLALLGPLTPWHGQREELWATWISGISLQLLYPQESHTLQVRVEGRESKQSLS